MPSTASAGFSFVLIATAVLAGSCGGGDDASDLAARQQLVAEAGAQVMPFDLDATTHIFTNTATGGIQDVTADNPDDQANIDLIRQHLDDEAAKFRSGDFSDPEAIHGPQMPGLAVLKARHADITVDLAHTPSGATLTYRTANSELVEAIHQWFAAQTSDHGDHAQHNP